MKMADPRNSALTNIVSKRKAQILGALDSVETAGRLSFLTAASMTSVVALLAVDLAVHGLRERAAQALLYLLQAPEPSQDTVSVNKETYMKLLLNGHFAPQPQTSLGTHKSTEEEGDPPRPLASIPAKASACEGVGPAPEMLEPGEIDARPDVPRPPFPPFQREDPPLPHPNIRTYHDQPFQAQKLYTIANKGIDLNASGRLPC